MAQFIAPPVEVEVTAPVPVLPYARVVALVPVDQSVPILKPVGKVAVADVPIVNVSLYAVPKETKLTCPNTSILEKAVKNKSNVNFNFIILIVY